MSKLYVLIAFTYQLLGITSWEEFIFRARLVDAVASVTDDENEQKQLLSLARYETGYHERLAAPRCECRKNECDSGRAMGTWQIIPRSKLEKESLCQTLEGDARLALARVHETRRACRNLPESERLAIWYRGSCNSEEGKRMSKISVVLK